MFDVPSSPFLIPVSCRLSLRRVSSWAAHFLTNEPHFGNPSLGYLVFGMEMLNRNQNQIQLADAQGNSQTETESQPILELAKRLSEPLAIVMALMATLAFPLTQ